MLIKRSFPETSRAAAFQRVLSVLVLLAAVYGNGFPAAFAEPSRKPKIGFILPLSGEWAFLGNGIRDGAKLAQEDAAGSAVSPELLFEDNAGNLASSATAASKLINVARADALVTIISGVGKLVKPMADQAQVIHVGICSDTEVADGQFSFVNYLTAAQGAAKYVEYFPRAFGPGKSVGIFALNEAGFQKIVQELRQRNPEGLRIGFVENFEKGLTDFRPLLLRHSAEAPDALLLLGLSPEIELIARQSREVGKAYPLTSIESFGLAADRTVFEGAWFVDSAVPNAQFRERFKSRYGTAVTPGTGHAYDTVRMLLAAFEAAATRSPEEFRDQAAQHFRSLTGFAGTIGVLSVHRDGVIWSEASVKRIVRGQPEPVEPEHRAASQSAPTERNQ